MTRARKIGFLHAALAVGWFATAGLDRNQIVNGLLGDTGCSAISVFFLLPVSWLAAMAGFPLFPSLPEHFLRMSLLGAIMVVNGLLVGYGVDRFLSWAGVPGKK